MAGIDSYPEFYHLCESRYSCRNYSDRAVTRDVLLSIIDAARLAPSACNRQPWRFIVLITEAERKIAVEAYHREWAATAQAFIVAIGDHSRAWHRAADGKDHTDVDVAIATEHICLAAASLGVGSCWICNFDAAKLSRDLHLAETEEPIAIISLGYPAEGEPIPEKKRVDIQQIVKWGID